VASAAPPPASAGDNPIVLASANQDEEEDNIIAAAEPVRRVVAVTNYETSPPPIPRLAPRQSVLPPPVVAEAAPRPVVIPAEQPPVIVAAAYEPPTGTLAPDFDFGPPQDWAAPAVPAALAKAMAERDEARRGASLPIPPTAVVATIDMSRPLRAAAITTAVLRRSDEPVVTVPRVMAYAPPEEPAVLGPSAHSLSAAAGIPMPVLSPRHGASTARLAAPSTRSIIPPASMPSPELTMTALDTQGLRLWIGPASTRQKVYALLTMPDFAHAPDLMAKPELSYGAGFGAVAYAGLRTDRFSGPLVQQPQMVDLTVEPLIASIR
jgi:hypothetical protein